MLRCALIQDVVKATKQDDGLVAVESRLQKLSSALKSIEEQLDHLEASEKLLKASPPGPAAT